ncbi:DNA primase small subunit-like [Penaeus japonicus]|uniref:DNA primase small subunit-like n=1 Tax=Penaeus japonicus TaxID=27405 RepID=UPI001C70F741|nr:DNA primase small subunit-like [Penaeus japonicus]
MPSSTSFDPDMLPDLLPIYYKRLFPYNQYYRWLSYGNVPKTYFPHREFCFTLADDIYVRYQSFKDQEEMEKEIKKHCPHKIDIGAVYSFRPKEHRTVSVFTPLEKELVFDIDMTDYDEVRTCCSGADICLKCWKFMTVAVKILDAALREDFGYQHLLWVYSGRRGVHCWVSDASARALSQPQRSAVAEYLQLIRGGDSQSKKVNITQKVHPSIKRAEGIAKKYFEELILEDQDLLGTPDQWGKVLALIPEQSLRESLEKVMSQCSNSHQRWNTIQSEINKAINKSDFKKGIKPNLVTEIILQLVYPRLDIHVTKGLNHLLKSPFCIHPKTGRVCVCFDPLKADAFDPMTVPNLSHLVEEINQFDAGKTEEERAVAEYKKTSMKEAVVVFDSFLAGLSKENASRRQETSDMKKDF